MNRRITIAAIIAIALSTGALFVGRTALAEQDGDQWTNVQISLPRPMSASTTSVMPGPTAETKYVIINMLQVPNISDCQNLVIDYKDFVLRTREGDAYYVNRRATSKLPLSLSEGVLGPGQTAFGSLAFLVPATMRDASLVYYVDVCGAVYFSY